MGSIAAAPTGRGFPLPVPIFRRIVALDENMEHAPPMLSSTHNQRVLDLASQIQSKMMVSTFVDSIAQLLTVKQKRVAAVLGDRS